MNRTIRAENVLHKIFLKKMRKVMQDFRISTFY